MEITHPSESIMSNDYRSSDEFPEDEGAYTLEGPGELGVIAINFLKDHRLSKQKINILDIGCGNGHDSFYFLDNLNCEIIGFDISNKAIAIATEKAKNKKYKNVKFECKSFIELLEGAYDIIFISGLYHFLKSEERDLLKNIIKKLLNPNGLLFLLTLSSNDTLYYGKGTPVPSESHSFIYSDLNTPDVYLHFSTRDELLSDFEFLDIKKLFEPKEYDPLLRGPENFLPWILIGEKPGN